MSTEIKPPHTEQDIIHALEQGHILLVPGTAEMQYWQQQYFSRQHQAVVTSPLVYSWKSFLDAIEKAQPACPVPLSELQERLLWESIIRSDLGSSAHGGLIRGLARHAISATRLMYDYHIRPEQLLPSHEECEALLRWQARLQEKVSTDFSERTLHAALSRQLRQQLASTTLWFSDVILHGFEALTPEQQAWLASLQAHGIRVEQSIPASGDMQHITCAMATEPQHEWRHIAMGVRARLEQQPDARILIGCADDTHLPQLARYLERVLEPEASQSLQAGVHTVAMAPAPLHQQPMVVDLLALLSLTESSKVTLEELRVLMFSPFLRGYQQEYQARAELNTTLHHNNRHRLSLKQFRQACEKDQQRLPALLAIIDTLLGFELRVCPASTWIQRVRQLIRDCGWLPDSHERSEQAFEHESVYMTRQINAVLETMAGLVQADAIFEKMRWSAFFELMRQQLQAGRLPQPARIAQVRLLHLPKLLGLQGDAIWLCGLNETAWPGSPSPHPLLPIAIQRQLQMPDSSSEICYQQALGLWRSILSSAPEVHISWPVSVDGKECLPSPLLHDLPTHPLPASTADEHQTSLYPGCGSIALEPWNDAPAVVVADGRGKGGSGLLRDQSACPFRAFASHRLGIKAIEDTSPGIDSKEKGSLLHKALEIIWQQLVSQQALLELMQDETAFNQHLQSVCRDVLAHSPHDQPTRHIESQRLQKLLHAWLQLESLRPPFRVVAHEQSCVLHIPTLHGLVELKVQVDRIDMDTAGQRMIIDYKSGKKISAANWLGERPKEPQLPLYAMLHLWAEQQQNAPQAICFARLRSGDLGFEGLSENDTGIKGIKPYDGKAGPEDWQGLLEHWQQALQALAGEYLQGRCEVAPRDDKACEYCGLEGLCRIEEKQFRETMAHD